MAFLVTFRQMYDLTKISVVMPAYQEAANISQVLDRITKTLESRFTVFQIILVADGCDDRTAEIAREFSSDYLEVHEYFPNRGKGYALKYGSKFVKYPVTVFCDGDLDIHPESILVLYDLMKLESAQAVVGSKSHPNSIVEYPLFRRVQSWVFRQIIKWKFQLQVSDTQTGLKVFQSDLLLRTIGKVTSEGFSFDLELLARLNKECKIIEGPVWLSYKFNSTISPLVPLFMLRDIFRISRKLKRESNSLS